MTYQTCGEISCEECNDRYEKAMARIAELEAIVRELVEAGGHLAMREIANHGGGSQSLLWWNNQEAKDLALLNSGNEGNSADQ